ncbi:hypothetical protein ACHHYP_14970 [Achlya hypogyna]|uniref:Uncharacterized protein n=1 Tax=Achlya hypogyna TaxID=1202772 RepID=A0A1V9YBY4_ACHHY|nr:hypothetical protein ACHHYP_14970 [Achlya hypogyna]
MDGPTHKLVQLDSGSLEHNLAQLSTRITHVEDSIPSHPAFASFAERIVEVEAKIGALQMALPPTFHLPSALGVPAADDEIKSKVGICLDELRAAHMKLKFDHDLRFSSLQLELEKIKRALAALPTEVDHDIWKQSLVAEMADAILKSKSAIAAVEQAANEKLAAHALEMAMWKSDFEAALGKRIDGVLDMIRDNATAIEDVTTMTNTRLASQEEGISIMEQTAQFLRNATSRMEDDRTTVASRLATVESRVHEAVNRCAEMKSAVERQTSTQQTVIDCLETVEMKLIKRCEDTDAKITGTEIAIRAQRHHAELLVQDLRNNLGDHMAAMDLQALKLESTAAHVASVQTQLDKTHETVRSHHVALELLAKLDTMLLHHQTRFADLDRSIAAQNEKDCVRLDRLENDHSVLRHHVKETEWVTHENNKIFSEQLRQLHQLAQATETATVKLAGEFPGLQYDVGELRTSVEAARVEMKRGTATATQVEAQLHDVQHRLTDWRGTFNVRFETCENFQRDLDLAIKETSAMLDQVAFRLDDERKHTMSNFKAMHHLVDNLLQRDVMNSDILDERLGKFAAEVATVALEQEHFLSHSTVFPEDRKQQVADCIFQATALLSGDVRHHVNRLALTEHHVDDAAVLSLRSQAAQAFASRVRHQIDTMAPTQNHFLLEARTTFERRVHNCVELTLSFVGSGSSHGKPKRPSTAATCISCDRPIFDASAGDLAAAGTNQDESEPAAEAKKTAKLRPMTAGSGRVDVKSVIPRRSGTSTMKPKTSGGIVHVPPSASGEQFVYRGGFRIPRTAKTTTDVEVNMAIRHIDVNLQDKLREEPCLEKTALRGRCQVPSHL